MKAQVMRRAWELAKAGRVIYGGNSKMYFAQALRIAWAEAKGTRETKEEMIARLEAVGFKRWTKNGMDRMYVNANVLGLHCVYRRTGSISEATFNGEYVSNRYAGQLKSTKTYLDLTTMEMHSGDDMLLNAAKKLAKIA